MVIPELPDEDDLTTLTKGLRQHLINKIIKVVVPHPDIYARYDARMLEFTEYVKYMERKAFEKVRTKDDYYANLAKIILRMQKQLKIRAKGSLDDPYGDIPLSHELADFMGLTQEELEEFDEEQHPQGPSQEDEANSKATITRRIRIHVIDKLGSMLFPAPDPNAYYDGRMDRITRKLKKLEAEAFRECEDRDDYYNMASLKAYRLQKTMKRNGEPYVDKVVKYPAMVLRTEIIDFGCISLPEPK